MGTREKKAVQWRRRLLAVLLSSFLGFLVVEIGLRLIDGYAVFAFRLEETGAPDVEEEASSSEGKARAAALIARAEQGGIVKPGWFVLDPPPLGSFPVDPRYRERRDRFRREQINYAINLGYLQQRSREGDIDVILRGSRPETLFVFDGPDGSPHPAFRYPVSVTLPSGLTTNDQGWRGPQVSQKKPPGVVRIACVGASTTVCSHHFPHSYPELLQGWLNVWANRREIPVRFEVINAGREGLRPADTAAIVKYELAPFEPDYIVYYEGANHFRPQQQMRFLEDYSEKPPADLVPSRRGTREGGGMLEDLAEYLAVARRIHLLTALRGMSGQEPQKPRQEIIFPDELDEQSLDPDRLGGFLRLDKDVIPELDRIRDEAREIGARMVMTSFCWMVQDGLELNLSVRRHAFLFADLNRLAWPVSYANLRRLVDLQNRIFAAWSVERGVAFIDVASAMPVHEDLFLDSVHTTLLGTRIRAWCVFEGLVPVLIRDLEAGRIPRRASGQPPRTAWNPTVREMKLADIIGG